uniref:Nucleoprotein n=1 Tax=Senecio virus 1 TaxID=2977988 RepID=A0A9N6YJP8_9RHAB|nr:TPA_asm: nucleocapsid protein [Senecio virus 1]
MAAVHKVRTLPVLDRYDAVPYVTSAGVTKTDWTDTEILDNGALPLTIPDERTTALLVKKLLDGITGAMTEEDVYGILLLTWNMRSELNAKTRIFPGRAPGPTTANPAELSKLESLSKGAGNTFLVPENDEDLPEFNRAGCYYAASLVKLFTKDSDSWVKAQTHLAESYKKFTDSPFPFAGILVWLQSVEVVHRMFQTKPVFKKTLGQILYALGQIEEGRGMTMMLFEQHLAYTGLHSVSLFCKAIVGLRTSPTKLLTALHTASLEPALDQLAEIITKYMGSNEEGIRRETYKYARLYNSNMFSLLQTKNCTDLTCILGHLNKMCGVPGTDGVLQIVAISSMSEDAKQVYSKIAGNIFRYFKVTESAIQNPMYDIDD